MITLLCVLTDHHHFRFAQWGVAIRKEDLLEQLNPSKANVGSLRNTKQELDEILPKLKEKTATSVYEQLEVLTYQYLDALLRLIGIQEQQLDEKITSSTTCIQNIFELYHFMESLSLLKPIVNPLKDYAGHLKFLYLLSQKIDPGSPLRIEVKSLEYFSSELSVLLENVQNLPTQA